VLLPKLLTKEGVGPETTLNPEEITTGVELVIWESALGFSEAE
jgi:hypothetical protein